MKTASTTLTNYINTIRGQIDAPLATANCYLITLLKTGVVLAWTDVDTSVTFGGTTYSATGPLIQGLKYKAGTGLEVDKQQVTISARPTDLISGVQALQAIAEGAFDGAEVQRYRVFLNSPGGTVIDGVLLFQGKVSTVDSVGRTSAQITVASDLIILDYDMPRNVYQPTCNHVLYDSGCTLVAATYAQNGTVGAGSTATLINYASAAAQHAQGKIVFTSGASANLSATVKSAVVGASFTLMYPLPAAPATGDAFTVYFGCDHTNATCTARFNNLPNFRGFPFVPPPQIAY